MRNKLTLLLLILALALTACGGTSTADDGLDDGVLDVVTTLGQIGDIAREVGGENVRVAALMGPGVDPHLYVATASDVDRLQEADIIFYNGLFLEAQMESILEQIAERKTAVAISRDIDRDRLLDSPTYQGEYDPHIWFDVQLWMEAVRTIRDVYIAEDPDHADAYNANADAYLEELEGLHQYVLDSVATLPREQRILVTAHDAFNYFGRAYGFDVRGLQGISTQSEASTGDVQELATFIADARIRALFIESSVPRRNVEAVQAAVAAKGHDVIIGGELFSDAMGSPDSEGGTYIGMVRHNVDTIVGALGEG